MSSIRNRILEMRTIDPAEVQNNERNWRAHPQAQRDALRGILADVGIAGVVTAYHSERQGGLTLIDGHERMTVNVPFPGIILDVTDEEADLLLLSIDPLAAMAETNAQALEDLLHTVNSDNAAVQGMLSNLAVQAGLVPPEDKEQPEDFASFDEAIDVEFRCPSCGYEWSGKAK